MEDACYRVAQSSDVGRHVVSSPSPPLPSAVTCGVQVVTRPLRKGEVVFRDSPLVTGPSRESEPCCVSCYRPLDLTTAVLAEDAETDMECDGGPVPYVSCPKCGWPLCSLQCSEAARHAPECELVARAGLEISAEDTDSLYDVVTVIRCLHLKNNDKRAWAALLTLQEANPEVMDKDLLERAKMVTGLLCGTFKIGQEFPADLVFGNMIE